MEAGPKTSFADVAAASASAGAAHTKHAAPAKTDEAFPALPEPLPKPSAVAAPRPPERASAAPQPSAEDDVRSRLAFQADLEVQCPACGMRMRNEEMYGHLDVCLATGGSIRYIRPPQWRRSRYIRQPANQPANQPAGQPAGRRTSLGQPPQLLGSYRPLHPLHPAR